MQRRRRGRGRVGSLADGVVLRQPHRLAARLVAQGAGRVLEGQHLVTLGGALNDGESVDLGFGPVSVSIDYATFGSARRHLATLTADVTLDLPGVSIDAARSRC